LCKSVAPDWGEGGPHPRLDGGHTPDQIIRKLAEGNKLLAGGTELDEVCRHLDRRVDVASLGRAVRWHEGRRREAAQGTRTRKILPHEMPTGLIDAESNEVLNGSGTAPQIKGQLQTAGVGTVTPISLEPPLTTLQRGITSLRAGGRFV
jgi:hypothetical protein